jgi:hypothetical protein
MTFHDPGALDLGTWQVQVAKKNSAKNPSLATITRHCNAAAAPQDYATLFSIVSRLRSIGSCWFE